MRHAQFPLAHYSHPIKPGNCLPLVVIKHKRLNTTAHESGSARKRDLRPIK